MLQRSLLILVAVFALGASTWIDGVEDLPLMPQLTRSATPPVVFDKPEGRIVQASAEGLVPASDVRRFYESSLPQLGWVAAGPLRWVRGKEKLTIELTATHTRTTVRFTVAPERKAGERE
ncbi:hypothetical protein [Roseiterribacter gracilis]|uniref:Uncharacterized protein n=1 Tax=Roseiterribacter gracilis TaxID=2812848 RepID=A0A8S8XG67_9PROT|nr:hypothetical protein TMPK1_31980 [Rhodospirillales bacterium TMPK1]